MKILHTSDWHLGHKLYGRQRHEEFLFFLQWLGDYIENQGVEALIVAGDIFDSQTPSNRSLEMYYRFLSRISHSCCRHVVIVAGNHDSPTLLNAPRELLEFLNIHVVGRATDNIEDELIVLQDTHHTPELMVLAVPYLRDKDIRSSMAGESASDKQNSMLHGIRDHYFSLTELAKKKQQQLDKPIPLIATGHLFCQGGQTRQGDGIRELYVGTLIQLGLDSIPEDIDYLALGHLHLPQKVANQDNRRYSGAPLVMSFTEAKEQKVVLLLDSEQQLSVEEVPVPCFQALQNISGDIGHILQTISELREQQQAILLEIHYNGESLIDDLQEQIYSAVEGSLLEVLRISNKRIFNHILQQSFAIKTLEELTPRQVFQQCLDLAEIPAQQQEEMVLGFESALTALHDEE